MTRQQQQQQEGEAEVKGNETKNALAQRGRVAREEHGELAGAQRLPLPLGQACQKLGSKAIQNRDR